MKLATARLFGWVPWASAVLVAAGCGTRATSFAVPALVPPIPSVAKARPSAPTAAATAPLPEGVPIPPKRGLDPSFPIDGFGLLLGSTKTEAWLHFEHGTVVVDKATGCATESYPEPVVLRLLSGASLERAPTLLTRPDVLAALGEHVGLARRFGLRTPGYSWVETAFTPEGRIVYVAAMGGLFRSNDGARTFRLVSADATRPAVSPDGKWLVYASSDGRYVAQPTDGSEAPRDLTGGQTRFFGFDTESRARFTRSDGDVCLDTFTLDESRPPVSVCVPVPSTMGSWSSRGFQSVSPSGAYALVAWEEDRALRPGVRALSSTVAVVDMKTSILEKTLHDVRGQIDDEGNVVAHVMTAGGPDSTSFFRRGASSPKRLGDHPPCEWDGETAWIWGWEPPSTLGKRRCNLVRGVSTRP